MPTIDLLVLANHAEAHEGLLFITGGCWTDHWRTVPPQGPPPASHFGIGVAIMVPWDETNVRHRLVLRLEDEDGREVARVDGDLEMGRPPGIAPGADQTAVLAMNFDLAFPRPGGYRILAELAEETRRVNFRVHDRAG